jgi:molybdopterin molybdotransferase
MIPLEDAQQIIDRTLAPLGLERETLPVRSALGRTLGVDQFSRLDLPPFDKSAMDGYALPEGEATRYRVRETLAAGSVPSARLEPGVAAKVMTGAPVPAATARVVQRELVREQGEWIEITTHDHDTHVCPQGEDVRRGDLVLPAGTRITPADVGNLIASGIVQLEVLRPIRLAVFSTGEEITDDPARLRPGMIMDSNGPLLAALAGAWGMEVGVSDRLGDDRQKTAEAIRAAFDRADLVVLSGGVSAGDFDFVGPAMADAGLSLHFTSVATKPGKPTTYASTGNRAAFGLPGNPVAVFLTFHLYVLRAAARLAGLPWPVRVLQLPLAEEFRRRKADRQEYRPCRLSDDGRLVPLEFHGTADLAALRDADGLFAVPRDCQWIGTGERVEFLPVGRPFR